MHFVEVKEIPKEFKKRPKKPVRYLLRDFLNSGIKYAEIITEPGDYSRLEYARVALSNTCKKHGYPIEVKTRGDTLYLVRKDDIE